MTALVAKNVLDGSKAPATTTSEMKTALGSLRDFLAESLGTEGSTAFAKSLTTNGYIKLPGGYILQHGEAVTGSDGSATVNFPVAFPNGVYHILFTLRGATFATYSIARAQTAAQVPSVNFTAWASANNAAAPNLGFDWISIGF
jgi:hypothetical protein